MKNARFVFKMIGCTLLVHGIGNAAPAAKHDGEQHPNGASSTAASETVKNVHQPGSRNFVSVPPPRITGPHAVSVRPAHILPTIGPSPKQAHHQSPNPAIIGGPAHSNRTTAAINGTGMSRKR